MSPRKTVNNAWRLTVTGLSFAAFGCGGVLLSLIVLPLLHFVPSSRPCLRRWTRCLIHKSVVLLLFCLKTTGTMQLEIKGGETLGNRRGILVLANHPTFIDIVVLLSIIRDADCIVKSQHWHNLVLSGAVRAAGYIRNDSPEVLIEQCDETIRRGGILVIFPEGTRTRLVSHIKFQRGAAHIALRSGASIQPVILSCDPLTLTKDKKWYEIPDRPFCYRMDVRPVSPLSRWISESGESPVAARSLTRAFEGFFERELYANGSLPA